MSSDGLTSEKAEMEIKKGGAIRRDKRRKGLKNLLEGQKRAGSTSARRLVAKVYRRWDVEELYGAEAAKEKGMFKCATYFNQDNSHILDLQERCQQEKNAAVFLHEEKLRTISLHKLKHTRRDYSCHLVGNGGSALFSLSILKRCTHPA
ncbi:hypothetical protein MPTK1_1g19140 [Marchantia polymorpha subsp. ruderalis]|uniref:Uncharacterized protein n=2 Tax=Marchantia polymorpha TaxID=3197 RepID=A0A176W3R9_MARPO|nr:hypothetical protein AXG93_1080s1060 [Marchantia polymorpha subsp. ruderalis]PTQ50225.1 hypothetical protein MARPO_0001s0252 [Marchantia polymorpha]BBM99148.1 hypothetical protein Mp_1g19140 [Marchantia polymorpha subsp. ruderalis]|eukprot:PTQ50225.1 hypothetical protein MARPO_0001s0252 [Marchantia polymorpha]